MTIELALVHGEGLAVPERMIVAPSVAGVLVEGLGANVCFGFDVLSFFVSAGWMSPTITRAALSGA